MRHGTRLGVDVGEVRVGVAVSDASGLLATPVETLQRGADDVSRLAALVAEHDAVEVVVGLPRSLSGQEGPAAAKARAYADELLEALDAGVPFRLYGDGSASRSFTFVADAVAGTIGAMARGREGELYNIGGGEEAAMTDAIALAERIADRELQEAEDAQVQ